MQPRKYNASYEEPQLNRASNFRFVLLFFNISVLYLQRLHFRFFLFHSTVVCIKSRGATVKRLPVIHNSAYYIFISFGIIESILVTVKPV